MRRQLCLFVLLSIPAAATVAQQLPPTQTVDVVDTLFGVAVPDPYRWLETLDEPEVQAWFRTQAAYARATLDALPGHAAILERLRQLDAAAPPEVSLPREAGGCWFYTRRSTDEPLARGYVRDMRSGGERMLVDPATVEGSGTGTNRLVTFVPSPDGRLVLYGITTDGTERVVLRVRDIASGRDIEGPFRNQWNETAWWDPGGMAFYYWQVAEPGADAPPVDFDIRMVRHRLGTNPDSDVVVLSAGLLQEEPPWLPLIEFHPEDTVVFGRAADTRTPWYTARAADVAAGSPAWRPLFPADDSVVSVIPHGSELYVLTLKGTPRIVRTSRAAPDLGAAETLLTGDAGTTLQNMGSARDGLYVQWYSEGLNRLTRIPWDGRPRPVELPPATSIQGSDRYGS
jgi:prolyl oligopeptidase